jgi:hypothetical protein
MRMASMVAGQVVVQPRKRLPDLRENHAALTQQRLPPIPSPRRVHVVETPAREGTPPMTDNDHNDRDDPPPLQCYLADIHSTTVTQTKARDRDCTRDITVLTVAAGALAIGSGFAPMPPRLILTAAAVLLAVVGLVLVMRRRRFLAAAAKSFHGIVCPNCELTDTVRIEYRPGTWTVRGLPGEVEMPIPVLVCTSPICDFMRLPDGAEWEGRSGG